MDTRNTPTAQLTVPTTAAQVEGADKPDTAANTAVTTDGFKNDSETTAEQAEDDTADTAATAATAATEGEVKEGDQRPETVKEVKPFDWGHGDDAAPDAQSEPLDTVDSFFQEIEAKRKGKKEGETKEAAKDGDAC